MSRDLGLKARDDRLKAIEPNRSAIPTLALLNVPVAARFAFSMRDSLVGASNISGNETFTPDTSTVIGWLEASADARQWAEAQLQRSDLGIEGMEIADGFGDKYIRFNHSGLDTPIVLGFESKGTRRLLHLLPMMKFALDVTGLAILDEIDGDLHVDMLAEILNWFRSGFRQVSRAHLRRIGSSSSP